MSGGSVSESTVETVALDWLASLDWAVLHGPNIAPDTPAAERPDYGEVVLTTRLRSALARLNPNLPEDALEDALRRLTRPAGATLEARTRLPSDARRRGDGGARRRGGPGPRRSGSCARLRRTGEQRLARGQPVHGGREQARTAARHRAVRQRPAARRHRAEEPRRRERLHLVGLPAASDLQGGDPVAVHVQRRARRIGRAGGAHRRADGRAGVVQALAHDRGRDAGRPEPAAASGAARRRLQPAPAAGAGPRLHRVRGRRQRRPCQEDGRVPRVPRRADRRRRDATGGSVAAGGGRPRPRRPLRVAPPAGRRPRRPADRRGLAHPGVGQEPDDGVLRRLHHARPGDGESHRRRADGPQRPRRSTVHHLLAVRRPARAAACPGGEPRLPARQARGRVGRRCVHDDPEVLPRRARGAGNSSARGLPLAEARRSARGLPLAGSSRATGIRCCRAAATSW